MKKLVIVGGGTGGIMTAAQFLKKGNVSVTVIEPEEYHYYQPAWTLVGANTYDYQKTKRKMADVMPSGVEWIKEHWRLWILKKYILPRLYWNKMMKGIDV